MANMARETEDFAVEYINETEMGLRVFDGDKEVSLPKSQIEIVKESDHNGMMIISVPNWLAEKEGII